MKRTLLFLILLAFSVTALLPIDAEAAKKKASRKRIAYEGSSFSFTGTKTVRFGTPTRYVEKSVKGSGLCTKRFFGSDPAPYQLKECTVKKKAKKKKSGGGGGSSSSSSTTVTPVTTNGTCGSANGQSFSSAPATNLCTSGTASSVTGSGPFVWSCTGSNGGSTANCSANISAPAVATALTLSGPSSGTVSVASSNFTIGANGTISGTVVVTPSSNGGGGTFSPTTRSLTSGSPTGTFTYTPASTGTKTISIANNGSLTNPSNLSYTSNEVVVIVGTLPTATTLTPSITGTVPFSIGQPFQQGAITAGNSLAGLQMDPITYWPDGSVKHAIVSGTASMTSGIPYTLAMTIGSAATGTTITTSNLSSALSAGVTITAGAFGSASFGSGDWSSPQQTVASGPVMSSWTYRKQIGSDAHLVAWLEVRMWSTGHVEVFPWVENGYLTVANPTNKSATYTFTLGGTQRFNQAIDIKHHTRIPLIDTTNGSGSARTFSHWLATDPGVVPAHDTAYLLATKMVPNISWGTPVGTTLDDLPQDYTPNTLANDTNATGSAGGSGGVISYTGAYYIASGGDTRTYKALITHGLSAGSWPHHLRDESTNFPLKFSSYPNISISATSSPIMPATSGDNNYAGGYEYTALSHMPSWAYVPFLMTGRWWFLEEQQFMATLGYLYMQPNYRYNSEGFYNDSIQQRMRAWGINALAQALAITPSDHPLYPELLASWEANTDRTKRKYVDGTLEPGAVSPQGWLGAYSSYSSHNGSGVWWDAAFMHNYLVNVWGETRNIGLPQSSASYADHIAVSDWAYKSVVQRGDDGLSGRFNWRHMAFYDYPIGDNPGTGSPTNLYTATQSYALLLAAIPASAPAATLGLRLLAQDSDTIDVGGGSIAYLASAQSALALAVEHGASGALAAYQRVTSAPNFRSSQNSFMLTNRPDWGTTPRPPSWLATQLSSIMPGTWLDVSSETNVTAISDMGPGGSLVNWLEGGDVGYYSTNWPGKMTSEMNFMSIIGTQQGHSSDPTGAYSKRISLNLSTGLFSVLWNPIGNGAMGHVWDNNSSRPLNGYIYRWQWNDLYRANVIDRVFSLYVAGIGTAAAVVPMDVHPNMGAEGSIVWLQPQSASAYYVKRFDIETQTVSVIGSPIATNSYPVVSYHAGIDSIVVGGSDTAPFTMYKVSNTGVISTLSTGAPTGVIQIGPSSNGSIFVPDPLGRPKAWLVDAITTHKLYSLDLTTGAWTTVGDLPTFVADGTYAVAGSALETGALIVFAAGGRSGGASLSEVWIYKVN